jgi:hypothetical protein
MHKCQWTEGGNKESGEEREAEAEAIEEIKGKATMGRDTRQCNVNKYIVFLYN